MRTTTSRTASAEQADLSTYQWYPSGLPSRRWLSVPTYPLTSGTPEGVSASVITITATRSKGECQHSFYLQK